jgi:hypothetical protein
MAESLQLHARQGAAAGQLIPLAHERQRTALRTNRTPRNPALTPAAAVLQGSGGSQSPSGSMRGSGIVPAVAMRYRAHSVKSDSQ